MNAPRRRLTVLMLILAVFAVLFAPAPALTAGTGDCTPGVDGCIPTPAQCATGRYNRHWDGGYEGRQADCLGYGGRILHYLGGDANLETMGPACDEGASVENDVLVFGSYANPNDCLRQGEAPAGPGEPGHRFTEAVRGKYGAIATISPTASAIGLEVLRTGGNAIDAAVAATFAVGVIEPGMCGIGGAGFLVYRGADGTAASLDFREAAPAAVTSTTFDQKGPRGGQGLLPPSTGHRIVAVPGMVAGMAAAVERLGTRPLADAIAPAEGLARAGIAISNQLANDMGRGVNRERIALFPESARTLWRHGVQPRAPGARLEQQEYADSLQLIREQGRSAFYEGTIADLIAADMERSRRDPVAPGDEGLLTKADLESYEAIWREPLRGTYRGHEIVTMPPPASGVFAVEMLNILEGFDVASYGHSSVDGIHLTVEAQKLAWIDRQTYIGDPDAPDAQIPTATLADKDYAAGLRSRITDVAGNPTRGGLEPDVPAGSPAADSPHTTHISVVDAVGNAVALTCTMGAPLGSAVVAPGTGFFLNNGSEGFYRSGTVNEAGPGKRPLSNMTPLILANAKGDPVLVTGAAGGPLIPMGVVHAVVNVVDHGMDVARALDAARFSSPVCCAISMESYRIPALVRQRLVDERKHTLVHLPDYSIYGPYLQAVGFDPAAREWLASSDQRGADTEGPVALADKPKPKPSRGRGPV